MYASVGGELLHYGVKGMKWGVRKERETKGRKGKFGRRSDDDKKYDILDKDFLVDLRKMTGSELYRWYDNQGPNSEFEKFLSKLDFESLLDEKKPGLGSSFVSFGMINRFIQDPNENQYFKQFARMVKERDGYDFAESMVEYSKCFLMDDYDACVSIGNDFLKYWEEYKGWLDEYLDEEMEEQMEAKAKLMNSGYASKVFTEERWNGSENERVYVYRDKEGNPHSFKMDQINEMIDFIKEAESKKIDFRKTTSGKGFRKRNVTESAPVKVQKGKKIEISDKERSLKSFQSKNTQEELVKLTNSLIMKLVARNKQKEKVKKAKRENMENEYKSK